ncbi:MAG TPA: hypothetical protein VGS21_02920 [Acidimicrobiales bacterium]|nr:hypothetical protein [Acidimicrobiales bacterium]
MSDRPVTPRQGSLAAEALRRGQRMQRRRIVAQRSVSVACLVGLVAVVVVLRLGGSTPSTTNPAHGGGTSAPVVTTGQSTTTAPPTSTSGPTTTTERSTTTTTRPGVTPTEQKTFVAWTGSTMVPTLQIGSHVSGTCWSGSDSTSSRYAYRCMSGNYIYDPCLAPLDQAHATELVCVDSPSKPVVIFRLTAKLPSGNGPTGGQQDPWALQLTGGGQCVVATGAILTLHGVGMNYYCVTGSAGGISTTSPQWTVEYADNGSTTLHKVGVEVSWRIGNP